MKKNPAIIVMLQFFAVIFLQEVHAHELQPALLEIQQNEGGSEIIVTWKVSTLGTNPVQLHPMISGFDLDFRLALLGENFQKVPKDFIAAKERFKNRIVQYGYVKSRKKYFEWLQKGSIIISTAQQENFGMSVIEAIRCGCIPLLPNRLAYPEILPKEFHSDFLYRNQDELIEKLSFMIKNFGRLHKKRVALMKAMEKFNWSNCIHKYDRVLEKLAGI